jgi:cyclase
MFRDRRSFLLQLGALAGGAVLPRTIAALHSQAPSPFRWRQLDARTWIVERGGGNTAVLLERGGAVVIDSKVGGIGSILAREIASRVGSVQAVIITHHHGDHSGGISAFPGARIIAQRNADPRLRSQSTQMTQWARTVRPRLIESMAQSLNRDFEVPPNPAIEAEIGAFVDSLVAASPPRLVADELVSDGQELRCGDSTILVVHHGPAHTDNDIALVDPRRKLTVVGDLLFNRFHPFIDVSAGATTSGWQGFIEAIARRAPSDTRIIAGHGDDSDLAGLRVQSAYFDRVRAMARAARAEGRTREQFMETPNGDFSGFGFADGWKANLGVLFDETA